MCGMKYTYKEHTATLPELARIMGIKYQTLMMRLHRGMTLEEALGKPVQEQNTPAYIRGTKICSVCKQDKPLTDFTKLKRRSGNEYQPACRECDNLRLRSTRQSLRQKLIAHYSNNENKCAICGENRIEVLDLDHIEGGGSIERRQYKNEHALFTDIIRQGYPCKYRVLCRNCNWIEHLRLHKKGAYYV